MRRMLRPTLAREIKAQSSAHRLRESESSGPRRGREPTRAMPKNGYALRQRSQARHSEKQKRGKRKQWKPEMGSSGLASEPPTAMASSRTQQKRSIHLELKSISFRFQDLKLTRQTVLTRPTATMAASF